MNATGARARAMAMAAVVAAAGCAGAEKSQTSDGGRGGSTGTGSGGSSGSDGGAPLCQVNILPVSPASFVGLVAAPGARLRVRGNVTGLPGTTFTWSWRASFADGSAVETTAVGGDPSRVELAIERPGSYAIEAQLVGPLACVGRHVVTAAQAGGKLASFRFRFTPPAGAEPRQEQEIQVVGGTPSGGNVFVLEEGTIVRLDTRDATTRLAAPAYLRLQDPAQRLVIEARAGASAGSGGATTADVRLPPGTFDLLVVPDGALAPALVARKRPAELAAMGALMLAAGEPVAGTVRDARGPVAGARVVLRAGALPSTPATSAASGAFTLRAATGTYAASVTLPLPAAAGGATLEAALPATAGGLVVPAGGLDGVEVTLGAFDVASLNARLAPAGASAGAGDGTRAMPRVELRSSATLPGLVRLRAGAAATPVELEARVRGALQPRADGTLVADGLPAGRYELTVVPGAGDADAITSFDVTLAPGDTAARDLSMGRKVALSGRLLPSTAASGIAVTALDLTGGVPIAIPGVTTAKGAYEIAVSPLRTYALLVRPGLDRALAPAFLGRMQVLADGLVVGDRTLRPALLYAGQVRDHAAVNGSPATLVQVFCIQGAPDCDDPDTALAETVTGSDGTFTLHLPDPGID